MTDRLPAYAMFAALLAAAGLPIYIHAPKFYVDEYGVSLAALGAVLFALRLFDFVQDPALGWLSSKLKNQRALGVGIALALMSAAMYGLFAVTPPMNATLWFGLTLTALFTAFSFLTINFYAQGVNKADSLGQNGHVTLASWRETGALLGVCVAAVAPTVLSGFGVSPFTLFAIGFVCFSVVAGWFMRVEWTVSPVETDSGFAQVLSDPVARRLLLIALANAAPVAVSSTLFLFFVESRLNAAGWEGPLLLLFFLSAAIAAPFWGKLAKTYGAKRVLMSGMTLSIVAFAGALFVVSGDVAFFAVICFASGAALGADMTLLPAIFAARMAKVAPNATHGFGLWSFVSKFTLAFAAIALLPVLDAVGFQAGAENTVAALFVLTMFYAGVPCVLKLISVVLLALTPIDEV